MKILAVDIGTGTQDILLYDSRVDIENSFKLVVPSPTMIVRSQLMQATQRKEPVLLKGYMMGGGPSQWAAEDHLKAGLPLFATADAARTFNDDLQAVEEMGVQIVSENEAARLANQIACVEFGDFNFEAIQRALDQFGISLDGLDVLAVAVFDHGDAPPGFSDRQFRFDYLDERIRARNRLSAFAYAADQVPAIMTRLQAVVQSASQLDLPLVVMDTAPAAVLGARLDPKVGECQHVLVTNIGNFHTLAFRLGPQGIEGVFEHHTGLIDQPSLEKLIISLADGSLKHKDVFAHHGHGALIYSGQPLLIDQGEYGVAVTGPRRALLRGSHLRPYFAVPFGDMMIAGCFGLLGAVADVMPDFAEPILASLRGAGGSGTPPWEIS